ncbi:branched-chain amino acid ABC transporter permease [archaeon SCG-AAA382B04]|nr:branched-chain amino acid ABC transporter permease [archaeon SCG-AAA382B04]
MVSSVNSREFLEGMKKSFPIVMGYLPIGIAFGVLANEASLSVVNASLMSFLVFAGASQFIAVGLLERGLSFISIVVTTLLVNSRHILMSASLSKHFKKIGSGKSSLLAFGITDETFALNSVELEKDKNRGFYFILGVNLVSYLTWSLSTIGGALLGGYINDPTSFGLNFALPAMFIALLAIHTSEKTDLLVIFLSVIISIMLLPFLGSEWTLIISTILVATIGVMIKYE